MIVERGKTAHLRFDPIENIVYYTFPNVVLDTREQIVEHFDWCLSFLKRNCAGQKVYCIVNLDGIHVNARHTSLFASRLLQMLPFVVTIVRYGGSALQRTASRVANMKLHTPSHIYASHEKALAVVRALKSGEMTIEQPR